MIILIENIRLVKEHIVSYTPISDIRLVVTSLGSKEYYFEFANESYRDYIVRGLDAELGDVRTFIPPKIRNHSEV